MAGATYGDAIIAGLQFAERSPIAFFFTVPFAGMIALAGAFLLLKIVVIGPLTGLSDQVTKARKKITQPDPPRLPEGE